MTNIDSRARSVLRELDTYKPGGSVDELKRLVKGGSVIKLASNENALGPSPKAVAALRAGLSSLHRYPDEQCSLLREKLAKKLRVDPNTLIFGNGSDELIVLALRAFVDPGDEVVVAEPTFLIYSIQAKACGATLKTVPMKNLKYDLTAMRSVVNPHTKIVFIANPDNPTGSYVDKKELETFLQDLPPETIVFIDEAYYEFVDAKTYPQTLGLVKDNSVIVTRSFSKAYGLAGLRVGYGIAQPALIAAMDAVREPFNVNSLAQRAAAAALSDTEFLEKSKKMLRQGRKYLTDELDKLKLKVISSVTNFMLIEFGPKSKEIAESLRGKGIMVREMSAWKLEGFLRVTIGTMSENKKFIQALKTALR